MAGGQGEECKRARPGERRQRLKTEHVHMLRPAVQLPGAHPTDTHAPEALRCTPRRWESLDGYKTHKLPLWATAAVTLPNRKPHKTK